MLAQTRNTQVAVGKEVRHSWRPEIIPWLNQRVVVRGLRGTLRISDTLDGEVLRTAWPARRDSDRIAGNDLPGTGGPNIVLARAGTNNVIIRIRIVVSHTPENISKSFFDHQNHVQTHCIIFYLQRPLNISFVNDPLP